MTKQMKEALGTDINGKVDFSLMFPTVGARTTLAASTEQTTTIPVGFNRVFFSYTPGTNVFVGLNATITLPTGSFASSITELNPSIRQIDPAGGDVLHFISDTATYVQVRYDRGAPQS